VGQICASFYLFIYLVFTKREGIFILFIYFCIDKKGGPMVGPTFPIWSIGVSGFFFSTNGFLPFQFLMLQRWWNSVGKKYFVLHFPKFFSICFCKIVRLCKTTCVLVFLFFFHIFWCSWRGNQPLSRFSQIWLLAKYERKIFNIFTYFWLPVWTMYINVATFLDFFDFLVFCWIKKKLSLGNSKILQRWEILH
jgi:hypothetical protein